MWSSRILVERGRDTVPLGLTTIMNPLIAHLTFDCSSVDKLLRQERIQARYSQCIQAHSKIAHYHKPAQLKLPNYTHLQLQEVPRITHAIFSFSFFEKHTK